VKLPKTPYPPGLLVCPNTPVAKPDVAFEIPRIPLPPFVALLMPSNPTPPEKVSIPVTPDGVPLVAVLFTRIADSVVLELSTSTSALGVFVPTPSWEPF